MNSLFEFIDWLFIFVYKRKGIGIVNINSKMWMTMEQLEEYANILKIMAHPIRLRIVKGLIDNGGCNVSKIYSSLGVPQSTISQHLSKLKSAGLVTGDRKGNEIIYSVESTDAMKIISCMLDSTKEC